MASGDGALDAIVVLLHSTEAPDAELILQVGCGVLESLLFEHEEELWPQIERLARSDIRFRRALACVWAYDSPAYQRRESLLAELGERQTVTLSFIVEPADGDFAESPSLEYRALEIDARPPVRELPRMLREIADKYQRTHSPETPILVRNHRIRELSLPWWDARSALIRAWRDLDTAVDADARSELIRTIDSLVAAEAAAWVSLRAALHSPIDDT
jgi:hypothetical protein